MKLVIALILVIVSVQASPTGAIIKRVTKGFMKEAGLDIPKSPAAKLSDEMFQKARKRMDTFK